jgi:uncharacterized protein YbjT (DUF2867 family)
MGQRVLVIGATGLLGEPVARSLQQIGYTVLAMSRDASRARAKFPEPFEVVQGDALNGTDLERALADCDGVHASIDHEREDECVAQVVEAAHVRGIGRITYISGTTVCEENRWFRLVQGKLRAERAIQASGIAYSIFCPGWFMEMLPRFVRDGRAFLFGRPRRPWHFVSVSDLARMVAESYRRPEARNKRLYIHGPEALTVTDALARYLRILHPDIPLPRPTPLWLLRLIARATRNQLMRRGVEMVAYLERVGERGDPTEANAILGAPTITLDAWLEARKRERATSSAPPGSM